MNTKTAGLSLNRYSQLFAISQSVITSNTKTENKKAGKEQQQQQQQNIIRWIIETTNSKLFLSKLYMSFKMPIVVICCG